MMMKKTLIATAMLATTAAAQAEISANVSMASDYVFRGASQTDNQMALQGGFDYAHESGVYVGTWASNVDSSFFNGGSSGSTDPQLEVDLYAGYSSEIMGFGYDVGYLRYQYPGYSGAGTNEWHVNGSYSAGSFGDFSLSANYSPTLNFWASDQSGWYWKAGYDTTLPWYEIGLSAHIGYSTGDAFDVDASDIAKGDSGLSDSYTDWSIGLSKSVYGVDLGITYTDLTDLKAYDSNGVEQECKDTWCDSKVVFSISKSF
jgi:uncharacterized protein (TIGR02001 family)